MRNLKRWVYSYQSFKTSGFTRCSHFIYFVRINGLPESTSFEVVEPLLGGHKTEFSVEFPFLMIVKAWIISLMVMFCVTELSFKVSLFSIVVDEEEEDGGVNEFKIDSNGISVLIIENKKLI